MWPAFKRFFTDQVYFVQVMRFTLMGLGGLLTSGALDLNAINSHLGPFGWWVGLVLMPAAVFLRAGESNTPVTFTGAPKR